MFHLQIIVLLPHKGTLMHRYKKLVGIKWRYGTVISRTPIICKFLNRYARELRPKELILHLPIVSSADSCLQMQFTISPIFAFRMAGLPVARAAYGPDFAGGTRRRCSHAFALCPGGAITRFAHNHVHRMTARPSRTEANQIPPLPSACVPSSAAQNRSKSRQTKCELASATNTPGSTHYQIFLSCLSFLKTVARRAKAQDANTIPRFPRI